jgi:hypothetical protein
VLKIRKMGLYIGFIAGILSLSLWLILIFFNPYATSDPDSAVTTFFMLFLPACLAIFAILSSKYFLMLIAFLWSLPISFYLLGTPGIFAMFGATSISYLISFLLVVFAKRRIKSIKN